jgi:hypothetical protein
LEKVDDALWLQYPEELKRAYSVIDEKLYQDTIVTIHQDPTRMLRLSPISEEIDVAMVKEYLIGVDGVIDIEIRGGDEDEKYES